MFSFLLEPFMIYALLIALTLAISASLLSPFLVLNNQAMIADGLSHVAFSGIVFGLLFLNQPIYFAIPFTIIAALLITYLNDIKAMKHDAAIGVVSAFSLAIGMITISSSNGFNISIESLLTGSILTSSITDVFISLGLLVIIGIIVLINYRMLLSNTFDETFAKVKHKKQRYIKYLLAALTGLFVVVGVRSAGMLLISSFLVFPALISSSFSKSFKQTIIYAIISSILTILIAIFASFHLDIPTASTIVVVYTIILLVSIISKKIIKK